MSKTIKTMIDPNDAVMLLIDHQSGLFQLVRDIDLPVLRSNVTALAKVARLARIPTFTTASVPDGPNGPLIPEIHQHNPDAVYIPRTGQINAWDNPAWVKAIKATGRKTLLIAGTLTSVCMAFPTLSALAAGYKVFTIVDASGNWSRMATDLTIARVAQAGAMPIDTYAVLAELMSTWNRPDAMDFAAVMVDHLVPPYRALMESYAKAQSVQKDGRETKLELLEAGKAKQATARSGNRGMQPAGMKR
jgi:nicotinamidase-related amidase